MATLKLTASTTIRFARGALDTPSACCLAIVRNVDRGGSRRLHRSGSGAEAVEEVLFKTEEDYALEELMKEEAAMQQKKDDEGGSLAPTEHSSAGSSTIARENAAKVISWGVHCNFTTTTSTAPNDS